VRISLTKDEVLKFAALYEYDGDDTLGDQLNAAVLRGFMTRNDLVAVARWKWRGGRTRQLAAENTEEEVREISGVSFAAYSERLRIGALLSLRGVQWPMASVILHFGFPDRYPILDVRAMNTVGGSTFYTFEKWREYFTLCRQKASEFGVSMRMLDQALWTYNKLKVAN
jgi:hypothetical protein